MRPLYYMCFALALALSSMAGPSAFGADSRGYEGGRYSIDIGGENAGWVKSEEGGGATSDKVEEHPAVTQKHRSGVTPGNAGPAASNGIIIQGGLSPIANVNGDGHSDQNKQGIIIQGGRVNGAASTGLGSHAQAPGSLDNAGQGGLHSWNAINPKHEDPAHGDSDTHSRSSSESEQRNSGRNNFEKLNDRSSSTGLRATIKVNE